MVVIITFNSLFIILFVAKRQMLNKVNGSYNHSSHIASPLVVVTVEKELYDIEDEVITGEVSVGATGASGHIDSDEASVVSGAENSEESTIRNSVSSDFQIALETDTFIAYQVIAETIASRPSVVNCFAITIKHTDKDSLHFQNGDIYGASIFVMASFDKSTGPDYTVKLMFLRAKFFDLCYYNLFKNGDCLQTITRGIYNKQLILVYMFEVI